MRIIRAKDYKDMSRKAANIISAQVILKPDSVLGLATGSSPIGTYEQLVKWYEKGDLDFADVTTVNLDEYYGMKPENDQSYHYFMHDHFFDHVNIDPSRINLPNGMEPDEKRSAPAMTRCSAAWAMWISSCSASAAMAILDSTSRTTALPRAHTAWS